MESPHLLSNNSSSSLSFPLLDLPKEVVAVVCKFLTVQEALNLRLTHRQFSLFLLELKTRKEQTFLAKLHSTLLKVGLFLPSDTLAALEHIDLSKPYNSFEAIHSNHLLWFNQVLEILKGIPDFSSTADYCLKIPPQFLHPCPPDPVFRSLKYLATPSSFVLSYAYCSLANQQRKFLPSCKNRIDVILFSLVAPLLSSQKNREELSMEQALRGDYEGTAEKIIFYFLLDRGALHDSPPRELLLLAKQIKDRSFREAAYLEILVKTLNKKAHRVLYDLIEEIVKENLSPRTERLIIEILSQSNISKGIERALCLQDRAIQKKAFLRIFARLPSVCFLGEESAKKMFSLMEKIEASKRSEPAFAITHLFQRLVEKGIPSHLFWGENSTIRQAGTKNYQAEAITLILSLQVEGQPDKLSACQKAYQLGKCIEKAKPDYSSSIFYHGIRYSAHETEALSLLHHFFEIATNEALWAFMNTLFNIQGDPLLPSFLILSESFYRNVDERLQKEGDRQWISERLYAIVENINDQGCFTFVAHMITRFCSAGLKKDNALATLLIEEQKRCNGPLNPFDLSLFQEVQTPQKQLELFLALELSDRMDLLEQDLLSLKNLLLAIEQLPTESQELVLKFVIFVKINLFLRKGKPLAPFFEND